MTAPLDLDALQAKAEAATPGKWEAIPAGAWTGRVFAGEDMVAKTSTEVPDDHADAEYIAAADPETILALIERVEVAEADRDEWRRVAKEQTRLERGRAEAAEARLNHWREQALQAREEREQVAARLAYAWDEGYGAGIDYMFLNDSTEPEPDNPYRENS